MTNKFFDKNIQTLFLTELFRGMWMTLQYCFFFDVFSLFSTFVLALGYFSLFTISFHMINGIRHLSWDLALGLEIKNLYTTGMIVVGLVFVILVITILV